MILRRSCAILLIAGAIAFLGVTFVEDYWAYHRCRGDEELCKPMREMIAKMDDARLKKYTFNAYIIHAPVWYAETRYAATACARSDCRIIFRKQFLDTLNAAELKAVLAHELGHIANGDEGPDTLESQIRGDMFMVSHSEAWGIPPDAILGLLRDFQFYDPDEETLYRIAKVEAIIRARDIIKMQ